jgi:DNA repair photolyase
MAQLRWTTTDAGSDQQALFDDVVLRHVGRGEYRGLEFYHVKAKRLINHVPSYLPFDYTINAYRGCSHACVYCLDGDTDILMADGTTRPLRKIERGDRLVGTSDLGRYRRYTETEVLDTWMTRKPAFGIRLRDGRQIISSGDHRFLSDYGWRYVRSCGEHPQPDLAFGSRLLGIETLPPPPEGGAPYRLLDAAVVGHPRLVVEEISDLNTTVPMFDLTTTTGDFLANGIVSHNCFARPTHDYLGFGLGQDFDAKIVVKTNAVELALAETAPGRWAGNRIAMGTNTDPYQKAEGKYRLTRGIIEVLTERQNPFSILTKSTLVLRDLDVLTEAAARTDVVVDLSIPTLDEDVWRRTEPGAPHPRQRVEAVRRLNEAGISSGVLIAPVLPGISDRPDQLRAVAEAVVDAGARFATPMYLHLRDPQLRAHWFDWLAEQYPDHVDDHAEIYRTRRNVPAAMERGLRASVRVRISRAGGLPNRRPARDVGEKPGRPAADQMRFAV